MTYQPRHNAELIARWHRDLAIGRGADQPPLYVDDQWLIEYVQSLLTDWQMHSPRGWTLDALLVTTTAATAMTRHLYEREYGGDSIVFRTLFGMPLELWTSNIRDGDLPTIRYSPHDQFTESALWPTFPRGPFPRHVMR